MAVDVLRQYMCGCCLSVCHACEYEFVCDMNERSGQVHEHDVAFMHGDRGKIA